MSNAEIYDLLKSMELILDNGFPLWWGGYVIVKPKEILDIIDKIESAIPPEIQEAHAYGVHNNSEKSVYELADSMRAVVNTSRFLFFGGYVLIKTDQITSLIDKMYTAFPVEFVNAREFLREKR